MQNYILNELVLIPKASQNIHRSWFLSVGIYCNEFAMQKPMIPLPYISILVGIQVSGIGFWFTIQIQCIGSCNIEDFEHGKLGCLVHWVCKCDDMFKSTKI